MLFNATEKPLVNCDTASAVGHRENLHIQSYFLHVIYFEEGVHGQKVSHREEFSIHGLFGM